MKRVVLDCDTGCDDALGILLLLHADKIKQIKIEAIVCTAGNTSVENSCRNTLRLLNAAGRDDIPIYKGSHRSILPPEQQLNYFHGKDGFGDLLHEFEPDLSIVKEESSFIMLNDLIMKNPGEIIIICIGPLTNLGLTMRMYDKFSENIKEIFIMGGNSNAVGNMTSAAEFNFYTDPEAAYIVFDMAKCPITLLPWECSLEAKILLDWRFSLQFHFPLWNLIDRAERVVYAKEEYYYPCDAHLIAVFLSPETIIEKKKDLHISIELHGRKTRGQVVVDHLYENNSNVTVIERIDCEEFKHFLTRTCIEF